MDLEDVNHNEIDASDLLEYANWTEMTDKMALAEFMTDEIIKYIHFKPIGCIKKFTNQWNHIQFGLIIQEYKIYPKNTIEPALSEYETLLAGGKRLLRELVKIMDNSWSAIRIIRIGEGFDTRYFVNEWIYNLETKLNTDGKKANNSTKKSTGKKKK